MARRPHEIRIRDGAHGLVVWAAVVVIGTSLATFSLSSAVTTMSLSSAIKTGVDQGKSASSAIASSLAPGVDPMGYEAEALLRGEGAPMSGSADAPRQEVARILMKGVADGSLNADDRAYLARMVSAGASHLTRRSAAT
jgi:hypothetical protein